MLKFRETKRLLESNMLLSHFLNCLQIMKEVLFVHSCPPMPVSDKNGKKCISKGEGGFGKALCVSDDDSHSANI